MSLITCCPACGTLFKVVPDQLRISEGWVRCGHCAEVFDAGAHLQQPDAPGGAMQARGQVPVNSPDSLPDAPHEARAAAPTKVASETAPGHAAGSAGSDAYPPFVLRRHDEGELSRPFDLSEPVPLAVAEPAPAPRAEGRASSASRPAPLADSDAAEPPLEAVSFVRQARRRAFWRRGSVRALLALLALALVVLLSAQVAVQQRDRLAAMEPRLRPMLEALCEPLQCRIGPPRQIESIVIDSSTFNRLRTDAYRLSVTLKNQALHDVAMPSLELTLTDTQDQPVLRRVLAPRDLGPGTPPVIGAGAEWSTTLALGVNANGSTARIAGYRVLAFYP